MDVDRGSLSRFQVLCAQSAAWAGDGGGAASYHYDGISFWRRTRSGKEKRLPSWRVPVHGWRHARDCGCELCTAAPAGPGARCVA